MIRNTILAAILAVVSGVALADTDIDLFSSSGAATSAAGVATAWNVGPGLGVQFVSSGAQAHNDGYASVGGGASTYDYDYGYGWWYYNNHNQYTGGYGSVWSSADNYSGGSAGVVTLGNGIGIGTAGYSAGGLSVGTIDLEID